MARWSTFGTKREEYETIRGLDREVAYSKTIQRSDECHSPDLNGGSARLCRHENKLWLFATSFTGAFIARNGPQCEGRRSETACD
jgi:hypothetical protein